MPRLPRGHVYLVSLKNQPDMETASPGKPRTLHSRQVKAVRVGDLRAILQLSCGAGVFYAAGRVFRQHRGTCVGSQFSPVLSSMQKELAWQTQWNTQLNQVETFDSQRSEVFVYRYVDNRLILCCSKNQSMQPFREFMRMSFYGSTIQFKICLAPTVSTTTDFFSQTVVSGQRISSIVPLKFIPSKEFSCRHHKCSSFLFDVAGLFRVNHPMLVSNAAASFAQRQHPSCLTYSTSFRAPAQSCSTANATATPMSPPMLAFSGSTTSNPPPQPRPHRPFQRVTTPRPTQAPAGQFHIRLCTGSLRLTFGVLDSCGLRAKNRSWYLPWQWLRRVLCRPARLSWSPSVWCCCCKMASMGCKTMLRNTWWTY